MHFAMAMIMVIVCGLSLANLNGSLRFRELIKSIRGRATELPLAANLSVAVDELRSVLWDRRTTSRGGGDFAFSHIGNTLTPITFLSRLGRVKAALEDYRFQLELVDATDSLIAEPTRELAFVQRFEIAVSEIENIVNQGEWVFDSDAQIEKLLDRLDQLQRETSGLPKFLSDRMDTFARNARSIYHAWNWLNLLLIGLALLFVAILYVRFHRRIFRPLETLVEGSRVVAAGNFHHRIKLDTHDEVAELADALNAMTENFQAIKSDLNRQVQQRTKEVVRSEKMASVGFLAAGVAHEINNPLATIAWSAESLETRLYEILADDEAPAEKREQEIAQMKKYLQRIQDEAFRCKGITAGLLDFSRMGDARKTPANLNELVESVVDMVRPLSKYRDRNIHLHADRSIQACLNPQEFKQVALNLITNALGSVEPGGTVTIELGAEGNQAVMVVRDNGCGMDAETLKHLFEPFFTRRRDGQGTGLGLSITYQIIQDHNGTIVPFSDGPGCGSSFTVRLPLVSHEHQAAA